MLKIYLLAAVALLAGALGMNAQVVTTEPSPLQEDSQNGWSISTPTKATWVLKTSRHLRHYMPTPAYPQSTATESI